MRWLELSVETGNEAVEAVTEILGRLGRGTAVRPTRLVADPGDELAAREDVAAPYVVTAHVPDDTAAADAVASTERALWHLQAFGLGPVGELAVRSVDETDWADAWRRHYTPQRIGRLLVVPSWADASVAPDDVVITLDPGMAFGTGLHPSTRGCLELLQRCRWPRGSVLDVGSGSGILAIAMLALGAERAIAVDIDPVAVEATRANADRNSVGDRITALPGSLPDERLGTFDVVCANLVARVLVDLADRLVDSLAQGADLVAAGIVAERANEVESAFDERGATVVDRLEDGDWVSFRLAAPATSRAKDAFRDRALPYAASGG
ncbi:MAG: 50S ribosomal protein L11 methyltransferase [Chloroflexota bacterium]|nr:50S ribosomal protein L11 methyltransferase [Chloroflexota bacterium]